jgi:hypothetical protein
MRVLALAWIFAGFAASSAAAEAPSAVIKPFAGDDDLAIYGKPVADEVAAGLQRAGVKAEVVVGEVTRGDLIIELRAVKAKKLVRLEATVKALGASEELAQASAKPVKVAQLGQAAAQLARTLAPKLTKLRRPDPTPTPTPTPTPASASAPASAPVPAPPSPSPSPSSSPPPAPDTRPLCLIAAPEGKISGIGLRRLGISPMRGVVERAGFRAVEAKEAGMLPPEAAGEAARGAGARATVMVQVLSTNIQRRIVFFGRGRVQIVAIRDDGAVLFNRVVDTDTVVGSRQDGYDTIVGFMIRQAMEIVGRDLGRALQK